MKISLVINQMKENTEEYKELLLSELSGRGIEIKTIPHMDYSREELEDSDFIITLGGDGTLLRTAGVLKGLTIPILGINTGHLGYLTELSGREEIPGAIDALTAGSFYRDRRAMLLARVYRDGVEIHRGIALNEILLSRIQGISILRFRVSCDGQELSSYSADGIIVATPTGSTAYNLSAGGPVVSPTAPVYVLTPICAHSLNVRAVIMDDDKQLEIETGSERQALSFDGENVCELIRGDLVRIEKAAEETVLVKLSKSSFLEILREKMAGV